MERITLLSTVAVMGISCGPTGEHFFGALTIDSNLRFSPAGPELSRDPISGEYYSFFYGANLTMVDHLERTGTNRARLLYLEAVRGRPVDRTVKEDEIVHGAFGTVTVEKTCFFDPRLERGYSSVSAGLDLNYFGEAPAELAGPPKPLDPLTSLSLIRIFRAGEEYLVVAGNYEANGTIGSLHISGTEKDAPEPRRGNFVHVEAKDDRLRLYGIPVHFSEPGNALGRLLPHPDFGAQEQETLLVHLYGFGKLLRVEELQNGLVVSTRFLQPSVATEERVLDPVCNARFLRQQSLGLSTVQ